MTGFGDSSCVVDAVHYAVEIRSINNKFYKAGIRLQDDLEGLEAAIDLHLRQKLSRGSITVKVKVSDTTASAAYELNIGAIQHYIEQLSLLPHESGHPVPIAVTDLIALPGVLQPPAGFEDRLERISPIVLQLIDSACDKLIEMRQREGAMLHEDLRRYLDSIDERLAVICERTPVVVEEYHQRLKARINTLLHEANFTVNEADLIREVAVYAERSDIAEEVARLKAHLQQFRELIDGGESEPVGRTLDFLSQELLREANTIASKSNDAPISREIVEIKGCIDRIKEQVQNVE